VVRVLHTESSPNWGGQEARILEEIEWFNQSGDFACLAAGAESEIARVAISKGIRVIPFRFRGNGNLRSILKLVRIMRREAFDVVNSHSSRDSAHIAWLGFSATILRVRTKHISSAPKSNLFHKMIWRYGADSIVVTASMMIAQLTKIGVPRTKINLVGESVDHAEFNYKKRGIDFINEFSLFGKKLIVNVGMLRPDKGQHVLLTCVDDVVREFPDVVFIFVGGVVDAEYAAKIKKQAAHLKSARNVLFVGYRRDVSEIMAEAACIVLASTGVEAQSRIVPQAFAMKKPVIATDVGGVSELIGKTCRRGILVRAYDGPQMADSIKQVLAGKYPRVIESAYQFSIDELSRFAVMNKLRKIYEG